jgi:hypothetical protein
MTWSTLYTPTYIYHLGLCLSPSVTELTDIAGLHRQNTGSTTGMVQPDDFAVQRTAIRPSLASPPAPTSFIVPNFPVPPLGAILTELGWGAEPCP